MDRKTTYTTGLVEVVVYRPALEAGERKKKETALMRALEAYGKGTMKKEALR